MIGVFLPTLDPEKQDHPNMIVGSQVGSREYVKAMLRYLPMAQAVALFTPDSNLALDNVKYLHRTRMKAGILPC
jgi:hypothetical protein